MAIDACDSLSPGPPLPQSPLLMLPLDKGDDGHGCRFFCLKDGTTLALRSFPTTFSDSRCVGSSHSWLVLLDKDTEPYLLDPLHDGGDRVLRLPPIETFPCVDPVVRSHESNSCSSSASYDMIHLGCCRGTSLFPFLPLRNYIFSKAVLSANPTDDANGRSCWAVVIFGIESKLAFCRCKDFGGVGVWAELPGNDGPYSDVIFKGATLLALCDNGFIEAWHFDRDHPVKIMEIKSSFPQKSAKVAHVLRSVCFTSTYLVEAAGEILLLVRFTGCHVNKHGNPVKEDDLLEEEEEACPYRTLSFHVYVLDNCSEEWVGLDSIGDRAVFVGGSHSRSMLTLDFPELVANSVYFTDDNWDEHESDDFGGHDMGVYCLQSRMVKEICKLGSEKIESPPFWVFPSDYRSE